MDSGGNRSGELTHLELGFDRFEAATIRDACRAAGFDVELLEMDRNGLAPGFVALVPHRLLVRAADLEDIQQIVNRSFPQPGFGASSSSYVPRRSFRRMATKLVAIAILATILIPIARHVAGFF